MGLLILFATALLLIIAIGTALLIDSIEHPKRKSYAWALANDFPTCPTDLGFDFEEITVELADNSDTTAWVIDGEKPDWPVILFSHGWSSSRYQSLPRAAILAKFASKVIVYDQRGQGDSQAKKCTLGGKEPADLLAVMRQLDKILAADIAAAGNDKLVIFGSSMGAGVAIEAAVKAQKHNDYPLQLVGLIAEGPYRFGMTPISRQLWRRKIVPQPVAALAWLHMRFWHAGARRFDQAKQAAKLNIPLLVLHGEDDPISPVEQAVAISEAAAEGKIEIFPEAGHGHLAEDDPKRYLQAIETFINRVNQ